MTTRTIEAIRADILNLRNSESASKAIITNLAPEIMARIHEHQDVDTANRFILALSDANRKMVLHFMKEFSGHRIGEGVLGKRAKDYTNDKGEAMTPYQKAKDAFDSFVESGATIWQWAFVKKEANPDAPVDLSKAATAFHRKAKKAIEQGQSRAAVLNACIGTTFTVAEVINLLGTMSAAVTQNEQGAPATS